ncbi:ABC transporter substrate-binding protein [Epidermidibacterium keratini]|uniref:ABC transporter substrate-binding protein n=1 Tax=Epidermidibacterium keratini TaxID=1891644 RepID=A0A7L4YPU7_9ACTN|nr:ABC transporter substrate-binding protein [Epidermidibacterium keratini]QHC00819.1 ABC transporter substrate-binding protein [Epidermidibacterium keratini]
MSRRIAAIVAMFATATVIAGCSSTPASEGDGDVAPGYPITIETAKGEITIPDKPKRVVVTNGIPLDPLLALGIEPVAVDVAGGVEAFPWLADDLDPSLIDDALVGDDFKANPEAIATYEPDLIVAIENEVKDKAIYDQLASIAPVVTGLDANDSWDVRLAMMGEAVGESEKAAELDKQIRNDAATLVEQAPGLTDATYQWVRYEADGNLIMGNGSVLELFGLAPGDGQDNTMNSGASISQENLDQLNADVVGIWCRAECAPLTADPRFASLPAVQSDLLIWPDLPLATAMNSPGPLAIPYVMEQIGPQLTAGAAQLTG